MKNPSILILDDSKVVCALLEQMIISKFGYECTTCSDLKDLPEKVLLRTDLVILDYYFGYIESKENLNGLEYLKILKKINPNISVIAFSGQKNIKAALEMIAEGAVDYIDKNDEYFSENILDSIEKIIAFNAAQKNITQVKESKEGQKGQFLAALVIGISLLLATLWLE